MLNDTAMRMEVSHEVKRAMAIVAALALTAMVFSGVFGGALVSYGSVVVSEKSIGAAAYMAGVSVIVASSFGPAGTVAGAIWAA